MWFAMRFSTPQRARWLLLCGVFLLFGCAGVTVSSSDSSDFLAQRRADVLTSGRLSAATGESLRVIGSDVKPCLADEVPCRQLLRVAPGLNDEQRLSALAELWAHHALEMQAREPQEARAAWMEAARHAWAYLFFTGRNPAARAFEDRQTQVRDYYNYAVRQAVTGLFSDRAHLAPTLPRDLASMHGDRLHWQQWQIAIDLSDIYEPAERTLPQELIAASSMSFSGLRNVYRRDGFGAELVAVFAPEVPQDEGPDAQEELESPEAQEGPSRPNALNRAKAPVMFEEARYPAMTAVLQFEGATLQEVLATQRVALHLHDPYQRREVHLAGVPVPLAGNFTSGYGLWLARSGFSTQALRSLLGSDSGIVRPSVHLMQPYDPNRRLIVMLHGLASSPEAWINVANEVLGDEQLRRNYQIWQVYYPTNAPLALNNYMIRAALQQTLRHFDPTGKARASQDITLIGHSMGGVLSRLMVSATQGELMDVVATQWDLPDKARKKLQGRLAKLLEFAPVPQVGSVIFVAAPHRGTDFANHRFVRWAANLVTLPFVMIEGFADAARAVANASPRLGDQPLHIPNSIDNLSDKDPFLRATEQLPIASRVRYHSIMGNSTPELPLADSSDGIVPYASAHLDGAASELVIPAGHSVQETPQAIIEVRRILRSQLPPVQP